MTTKKITRYYSECGKGFWKKSQAIAHEDNCKCWKNQNLKSCISCKFKSITQDSNGMENEPHFLETWQTNNCEHSESGVPIHKDFDQIRKYCQFYEAKKVLKS